MRAALDAWEQHPQGGELRAAPANSAITNIGTDRGGIPKGVGERASYGRSRIDERRG